MHKRKEKKLNAPSKEINITKFMRVYNIMQNGGAEGGVFSSLTSVTDDWETRAVHSSWSFFFFLVGVAIKKCRKQETCEIGLQQGILRTSNYNNSLLKQCNGIPQYIVMRSLEHKTSYARYYSPFRVLGRFHY